MAKPIVAIVGRPNVGKSTIFNKLTGQRLAIVEDTPGVTRDRIFCDCEWSGHKFLLVDTGGIEPRIDDGLLAHMREQAQLAIDSADCIVMVTELSAGVTPQDQDVASMLMRSGKPVVLAVNKCDKVGEPPMELYDFYSLGLGELIPVSGVHGHGTGDLLDAVCAHLNFEEEPEDADDRITVAVIGRPNVGKSSLINHILGENRLIVANEAGTTRDAIDTMVENKYGKFVFTDTAGLRKKGKVESGVERYSVLRSLAAVERSRVCVIMIDATVGFTEQDSKVAGYAHEQGKACIIAVNKWDAVEKDSYTMDTMRKKLEEDFSFMSYAPIVFISAKTGQLLDRAGAEYVPCTYDGLVWDGGTAWVKLDDGWHQYTIPGVTKPDPLDDLPEDITAPDTRTFSYARVITEGGRLNLRAGPGTEYDIVGKIPEYTSLRIYGSSNTAPAWVLVQYQGQFGWTNLDYLERSC